MGGRFLLALSLLVGGSGSAAIAQGQQVVPSQRCTHIMAVNWRITHVRGRVRSIAVDQIIDPAAGATPEEAAAHPVQMELPPAYVAAVRAAFMAHTYPEATENPFISFTFYDPAQPNRADIRTTRDCLQAPPAS